MKLPAVKIMRPTTIKPNMMSFEGVAVSFRKRMPQMKVMVELVYCKMPTTLKGRSFTT